MVGDGFESGFSHWDWSELREFAEVLDGCGEVELILGAVWSSKAEPVKTDDAFEVCEQHLDLFPGMAGGDVGIGRGNIPRLLTGILMTRPGDLASCLVGRISGLQRACGAILLPGVVFLEAVLAERRSSL